MQRLQDRVAVITGAGSGIGLATARRFAEEGAKVVCVDIDEEAGAKAAAEVGGLFVKADVTSEDDVSRMYQTAFDTYGSVDIAFNNAGISPPDDDSILETGLDAWRRVQEVNLTSRLPVLQVRHPVHAAAGQGLDHQHRVVRGGDGLGHLADLLHRLQGRGAGHVPRAGRPVRPRGHPGQRPVPGAGQHAAAAGAVRQGPRAGRSAAWCTSRSAGSPRPSEIAAAVAFLASDDASFITGVGVPGGRRHLRRVRDPAVRDRYVFGGIRMKRPLIGITSYVEPARFTVWEMTVALLPYIYVEQVVRAGGQPVVLPPAGEPAALVGRLDGLILAGGGDIDPARYGEQPQRQDRLYPQIS